MNIYVIGPATGIPNDNLQEFLDVEYLFKASGINAETPFGAYGMDRAADWEHCMLISLHELTTPRFNNEKSSRLHPGPQFDPYYDGVATLDGWEQSKGARIEHDLAEALGIPCKPWREWLE